MASEKQKMLAGELYRATGEELAADARRVAEWMDRYNGSIAATQRDPVQVAEEEQNLWDEYAALAAEMKAFAIRKVTEANQIYPVFRDLFKKEGATA